MKSTVQSTMEATIEITHGSPDGTKGFGDQLFAEFAPGLGANLRTKAGRRRLRRFIRNLDRIHHNYELRYGE